MWKYYRLARFRLFSPRKGQFTNSTELHLHPVRSLLSHRVVVVFSSLITLLDALLLQCEGGKMRSRSVPMEGRFWGSRLYQYRDSTPFSTVVHIWR